MTTIPAEISTSHETRQRLLAAAGEVFARQGFRNATIREICRRARANLAAVNYHFGDKERLYLAVLVDAHTRAREKYPLFSGGSGEMPPALRLRAFIHDLLFSLLDEGMPAWYGKLMAREMIEPTTALDTLVENMLRPMAGKLGAIVRELLGAGVTDDQVRYCQLSIVSQCVHYRHARPVIQRLFPQQHYEPADIQALVDHITRFSLSALQGLARAEDYCLAASDERPQP
ncbi:MAG: CerR family C-terminal domain-containing protein [Negativicutes bacterium]|nr:CerR family C-terminal domain-containing protein [Negativicutes bacterium]